LPILLLISLSLVDLADDWFSDSGFILVSIVLESIIDSLELVSIVLELVSIVLAAAAKQYGNTCSQPLLNNTVIRARNR